jgi:leader peptidase (prepilin peptidase)/N-methyltransferase
MQYFHDLVVARPWVLAFWVFVIGGAIGSFLNVVIYRLPRDMSLSHPGSRCPKCGHAIRWYHNLPIAGWLLLRGKCYDCKAAISPRYPLVELAVAAGFVSLAYADVYVPSMHAYHKVGMNSAPPSLSTGLGLLGFLAHAYVGCTLLAAVLIRWDGQRLPWRLTLPGILVAAAVAPLLDQTPAGLLIGMVVAILLLALYPRSKNPRADARG